MATLTARDVPILASLRQYRYMNVDQQHQLFFDSQRRAQARTQWLREHHLIHRWAASDIRTLHRLLSVLSVWPRGAGVHAACLDQPSRPHVERARHSRDHCFDMVHDLEASGFFVDLAAACVPLREAGLYHWVGEEDCRHRYRAELAPDGWGRLLTPVGDVLFFLEWDRGTEPPGGGTTLVAARGLGFHAIDIERDRSYLPALICRVRQPVHLQRERVA